MAIEQNISTEILLNHELCLGGLLRQFIEAIAAVGKKKNIGITTDAGTQPLIEINLSRQSIPCMQVCCISALKFLVLSESANDSKTWHSDYAYASALSGLRFNPFCDWSSI